MRRIASLWRLMRISARQNPTMFRALAGALLSAPIVLDKEATPPARAIRTSGSMRGVWKRKP
jgi:hypothetical protein